MVVARISRQANVLAEVGSPVQKGATRFRDHVHHAGRMALRADEQKQGQPISSSDSTTNVNPHFFVTATDGGSDVHAQNERSDESDVVSILEEVREGKSIEQVADERDMTRNEVIEELEAAGYEVETSETGPIGSETRVTTIEDPDSGETITEYYKYDGTYDIVVVDGESEEYEVQEGDTLWDIAEAYGVTLDDLKETNPELFDDAHDGGDLIHPGETVVIDGEKTAGAALDEAMAEFDASLEESGFWDDFISQWAEEHEDAYIDANGKLVVPDGQDEELQAALEEEYQVWLDKHPEEAEALNAAQADYYTAVMLELRLAALEAERLGEDSNQAIEDTANEIRERDTNGHRNPDGSWHADEQDETATKLIEAAEEQVLGESQEVRTAQVELEQAQNDLGEGAGLSEEARRELEKLASALAETIGVELPMDFDAGLQFVALSDEELTAFVLNNFGALDEAGRSALADVLGMEPDEMESYFTTELADALGIAPEQIDSFYEAETALGEAIDQQVSDLEREVQEELAGLLGVEAPNAGPFTPDEPQTLADLSDEELQALIQDELAKLQGPDSAGGVLDSLDETARDRLAEILLDTLDENGRNELAETLGVDPDELGIALSDPGTLAEALGAVDEQAITDAFEDKLLSMAAEEVSTALGDNSYVNTFLFGNDYTPGIVDQIAIDLQVGELGRIIEEIDPDELSGVEKQLWEAGDQVSVALLRQLGVSFIESQDGEGWIDATIEGEEPIRLSGAEEELLRGSAEEGYENPVELALFLKAGFRLEGGTGQEGGIGLSFNGESYDPAELTENLVEEERLPSEDQQNLADWLEETLGEAQGNPAALVAIAGTLWQYGNDAENLVAEVNAAGMLRLEQVEKQISALMAEGKEDEARRILTVNLNATLSEEERVILWEQVGSKHFGQDYWEEELDAVITASEGKSSYAEDLADWFRSIEDTISPEMAQIILGLFEEKVDLDQIDLYDSDFFDALSGIVWKADQRADPSRSTSWAQGMAECLLQSTEYHPDGYQFDKGALTHAIVEGSGHTLAEAYLTLLNERGRFEQDWEYQDWVSAIEEAKANPGAKADYAAQQNTYFQNNAHNIAPDYFDRIMSQEGIGEAQEMVYGDELRELIATGMDLPADHAAVDFIMEQMFVEAGIDKDDWEDTPITVTVIPYIYASQRDGWATGALFDVDGPDEDTERTVYTGTVSSYTVTETDAFVIDGGVMANLANQAMDEGVEIDAITKEQPWLFDSVKNFQDKNYLDEKGVLYLPHGLGEQYGLEMDLFEPSAGHDVQVGTTAAAIETTGEKWMKGLETAVTVASFAAMLVPVGGLLLGGLLRGASAGLLKTTGMSLHAARVASWADNATGFTTWFTKASPALLPGKATPLWATLWGSTLYTAGDGAYRLREMKNLGIDIGWSNRMARSIYLDMIGASAGGVAMAGSGLLARLLARTGPGVVSAGAKAAYWGTQTANAIDLGIGAYLMPEGLRHLGQAGEEASAWERLITVMGGAMLVMGGVGMRQEIIHFNAHRNRTSGEYILTPVDEAAKDGSPTDWLQAAGALRPQLVEERMQHHWYLWYESEGKKPKSEKKSNEDFRTAAEDEVDGVLLNGWIAKRRKAEDGETDNTALQVQVAAAAELYWYVTAGQARDEWVRAGEPEDKAPKDFLPDTANNIYQRWVERLAGKDASDELIEYAAAEFNRALLDTQIENRRSEDGESNKGEDEDDRLQTAAELLPSLLHPYRGLLAPRRDGKNEDDLLNETFSNIYRTFVEHLAGPGASDKRICQVADAFHRAIFDTKTENLQSKDDEPREDDATYRLQAAAALFPSLLHPYSALLASRSGGNNKDDFLDGALYDIYRTSVEYIAGSGAPDELIGQAAAEFHQAIVQQRANGQQLKEDGSLDGDQGRFLASAARELSSWSTALLADLLQRRAGATDDTRGGFYKEADEIILAASVEQRIDYLWEMGGKKGQREDHRDQAEREVDIILGLGPTRRRGNPNSVGRQSATINDGFADASHIVATGKRVEGVPQPSEGPKFKHNETGRRHLLALQSGQNEPSGAPTDDRRRGDLNYLTDGSVTVNGKTVNAKAFEVDVPQDAILVIAEAKDFDPEATDLEEPLTVEKIVNEIRDLDKYKNNPGHDIVLYICHAGTRSHETAGRYASYSTSLAREVSSRLGARVHAIDGEINPGEETTVGKAVKELPNLPLTDISGGKHRQAPDDAAAQEEQRRYWFGENGRGPRVAEPFNNQALAQGAKVHGRPVDPMTLGVPKAAPDETLDQQGAHTSAYAPAHGLPGAHLAQRQTSLPDSMQPVEPVGENAHDGYAGQQDNGRHEPDDEADNETIIDLESAFTAWAKRPIWVRVAEDLTRAELVLAARRIIPDDSGSEPSDHAAHGGAWSSEEIARYRDQVLLESFGYPEKMQGSIPTPPQELQDIKIIWENWDVEVARIEEELRSKGIAIELYDRATGKALVDGLTLFSEHTRRAIVSYVKGNPPPSEGADRTSVTPADPEILIHEAEHGAGGANFRLATTALRPHWEGRKPDDASEQFDNLYEAVVDWRTRRKVERQQASHPERFTDADKPLPDSPYNVEAVERLLKKIASSHYPNMPHARAKAEELLDKAFHDDEEALAKVIEIATKAMDDVGAVTQVAPRTGEGGDLPRRRRGDLNYLGEWSVTVDGEPVDVQTLTVPAPEDAFVVIADHDTFMDNNGKLKDPEAVKQLVEDIRNHKNYSKGQDIVFWGCLGGTRAHERQGDPFSTSLAREVANGLGARVHAIDGTIELGEEVKITPRNKHVVGPRVRERPNLPLVGVRENGVDKPVNRQFQDAYAAQRSYWLGENRPRRRIPAPFSEQVLKKGARVEGEDGKLQPVDSRMLGKTEDGPLQLTKKRLNSNKYLKKGLSEDDKDWLTSKSLSELDSTRLANILKEHPDAFAKILSADELGALPERTYSRFKDWLNSNGDPDLSVEQFSEKPLGIARALSLGPLSDIDPHFLAKHLTAEAIGNMTLEQLAALTPKQRKALTKALGMPEDELFPRLSRERLESIDGLPKDTITKLTEEPLSNLNRYPYLLEDVFNAYPEKFAEILTPDELGLLAEFNYSILKENLNRPGDRRPALDEEQFDEKPLGIKRALTIRPLPDIDPTLLGEYLTAEDLGRMTTERFLALTDEQHIALSKQMGGLSAQKLAKFEEAYAEHGIGEPLISAQKTRLYGNEDLHSPQLTKKRLSSVKGLSRADKKYLTERPLVELDPAKLLRTLEKDPAGFAEILTSDELGVLWHRQYSSFKESVYRQAGYHGPALKEEQLAGKPPGITRALTIRPLEMLDPALLGEHITSADIGRMTPEQYLALTDDQHAALRDQLGRFPIEEWEKFMAKVDAAQRTEESEPASDQRIQSEDNLHRVLVESLGKDKLRKSSIAVIHVASVEAFTRLFGGPHFCLVQICGKTELSSDSDRQRLVMDIYEPSYLKEGRDLTNTTEGELSDSLERHEEHSPRGWGLGDPIVLNLQDADGQAQQLAQRLADIAGVDVFLPRTDNPSQWRVVKPSTESRNDRSGTVRMIMDYRPGQGHPVPAFYLTQNGETKQISLGDYLGRAVHADDKTISFELFDKIVKFAITKLWDDYFLIEGYELIPDRLSNYLQLYYGGFNIDINYEISYNRYKNALLLQNKEVYDIFTNKSLQDLYYLRTSFQENNNIDVLDASFKADEHGNVFIQAPAEIVSATGDGERHIISAIEEKIAQVATMLKQAPATPADSRHLADKERSAEPPANDEPPSSLPARPDSDGPESFSDGGHGSLSAAYHDPNEPFPSYKPYVPEIFRPQAPQASKEMFSIRKLPEGYVSSVVASQMDAQIPDLDAAVLEEFGYSSPVPLSSDGETKHSLQSPTEGLAELEGQMLEPGPLTRATDDTGLNQAWANLKNGTISDSEYQLLIQVTGDELRRRIRHDSLSDDDPSYLVFKTQAEPILRAMRSPEVSQGERVKTLEVTTLEHNIAVREIINHAILLARSSDAYIDGDNRIIFHATKRQMINYALNLIIALRKTDEYNQNLILRDADHYLSQLFQEWQTNTSQRLSLMKFNKPRKSLAYLSDMVALTYDYKKIKQKNLEQGGQKVRKPLERNSGYPAAPPGGRDWARLGTQHYLRDSKTMDDLESLHPPLLTEMPNPIQPGTDEKGSAPESGGSSLSAFFVDDKNPPSQPKLWPDGAEMFLSQTRQAPDASREGIPVQELPEGYISSVVASQMDAQIPDLDESVIEEAGYSYPVPPSSGGKITHSLQSGDDPQLQSALIDYIRSQDGIPFAEFMELSLYGFKRKGGYYNSGVVNIGTAPADHFETASEKSPIFGRTIARAFVKMYEAMGRPKAFEIVEMGAGNGTLARDIIEKLRTDYSDVYDALLRYTIVERSDAMVERQKEKLAGEERVLIIQDSADALPLSGVRGMFLSNELVDAFPVHRAVVRQGELKEVYVTVDEQGRLVEEERPPTPTLMEVLPDLDGLLIHPISDMRDGTQLTINARSIHWMRRVAAALEEGFVVTFDYGSPGATALPPRTHASKHDRKGGPIERAYDYERIGKIDMTSDVDYTVLALIGEQAGLQSDMLGVKWGYTQSEFLEKNGFDDELESANLNSEERRNADELCLKYNGFFALVQEKLGRSDDASFASSSNNSSLSRSANDVRPLKSWTLDELAALTPEEIDALTRDDLLLLSDEQLQALLPEKSDKLKRVLVADRERGGKLVVALIDKRLPFLQNPEHVPDPRIIDAKKHIRTPDKPPLQENWKEGPWLDLHRNSDGTYMLMPVMGGGAPTPAESLADDETPLDFKAFAEEMVHDHFADERHALDGVGFRHHFEDKLHEYFRHAPTLRSLWRYVVGDLGVEIVRSQGPTHYGAENNRIHLSDESFKSPLEFTLALTHGLSQADAIKLGLSLGRLGTVDRSHNYIEHGKYGISPNVYEQNEKVQWWAVRSELKVFEELFCSGHASILDVHSENHITNVFSSESYKQFRNGQLSPFEFLKTIVNVIEENPPSFEITTPIFEELEALTPKEVDARSHAELLPLSEEFVKSLTPEELAALTPEEIDALTRDDLLLLSDEQLQALLPEKSDKLKRVLVADRERGGKLVVALIDKRLPFLQNPEHVPDPRIIDAKKHIRTPDKPSLQENWKEGPWLDLHRNSDGTYMLMPVMGGGAPTPAESLAGKDFNLQDLKDDQQQQFANLLNSPEDMAQAVREADRVNGTQREPGFYSDLESRFDQGVGDSDAVRELRLANLLQTGGETAAIQNLGADDVANLLADDWQDVSDAGLQALDAWQIGAIPEEFIGFIDVGACTPWQISQLAAEQVGNIPPEQMATLSGDHLGAFTVEHVQALDAQQIGAIPAEHIRYLDVASLKEEQIPWLTDEQMAALSIGQLRGLRDTGLQTELTGSQLAAIPAKRIWYLDVANLREEQVPWLMDAQVATLSIKQFKDLSDVDLQTELTDSQLAAIPAKRIRHLNVAGLKKEQIPWLTDEQVAALSTRQLKELSDAGLQTELTESQLPAIPANRIRHLNVAGLKKEQIPWLTDEQVAALSTRQLKDLSDAGLQTELTESQLPAIPAKRIPYLDVAGLENEQTGLKSEQIPWLTPEQVANITAVQFAKFTAEQLRAFTLEQVEVIEPHQKAKLEGNEKAIFDLDHVRNLTVGEIAKLPVEKWDAAVGTHQVEAFAGDTVDTKAAFGTAQLQTFTGDQIRAIPLRRIKYLNLAAFKPEQFPDFSLRQVLKFTPYQMARLDRRQLGAFKSAQKRVLKSVQTVLLDADQLAALDGYKAPSGIRKAVAKARARGASDFVIAGAATGTLATVWNVLPEDVKVILNAGIILRGISLIAKETFPTFTPPHSPLGRALRGLDFLTLPPNIANGFLKPDFANYTIHSGNFLYEMKSSREARTGQRALGWVDKWALPLFFLGSAKYTWDSALGSGGGQDLSGLSPDWLGFVPDALNTVPGAADTVAGAMFTAGAFYLGYQAFRPSQKENPITPRLVDGVLFGGGMILLGAMGISKALDDKAEEASSEEEESETELPPPEEPEEPTPPEEPDEPQEPLPQLVVTAEDGLIMWEEPTDQSERLAVLRPGSLVHETGERKTDEAGTEWVLVTGYGWDNEEHQGWAKASFLAPHADGAQNEHGRFNPELENAGYDWVEMRPGKDIGTIARENSVDVAETVLLNMDHIINPAVVFAGDRIYLPASE